MHLVGAERSSDVPALRRYDLADSPEPEGAGTWMVNAPAGAEGQWRRRDMALDGRAAGGLPVPRAPSRVALSFMVGPFDRASSIH